MPSSKAKSGQSSSSSVRVRRATVDDVELIVALNQHVQSVHASLLPGLFKPVGGDTLAVSDVQTLLVKPEAIALIAIINDEGVGYAYAEIRRRAENPYVFANDDVYLHHISVAPQHRRCGAGTALMDAVKQAAADLGVRRVALDVWTVNEPARAFFKSHGFMPYNERLALNL